MDDATKARIAARIAARKATGMTAEEFNRHEVETARREAQAKAAAIQQQLCDFMNESLQRNGGRTRAYINRQGQATIRFHG
jgi:hypothetical protein